MAREALTGSRIRERRIMSGFKQAEAMEQKQNKRAGVAKGSEEPVGLVNGTPPRQSDPVSPGGAADLSAGGRATRHKQQGKSRRIYGQSLGAD